MSITDVAADQLSVNAIRTLSIDAVERAKSGHPGTPMALAPLVYTIWELVLAVNRLAHGGSKTLETRARSRMEAS